jgi:hypothetical protein
VNTKHLERSAGEFFNWFDQHVARQQLCKHGLTRYNR